MRDRSQDEPALRGRAGGFNLAIKPAEPRREEDECAGARDGVGVGADSPGTLGARSGNDGSSCARLPPGGSVAGQEGPASATAKLSPLSTAACPLGSNRLTSVPTRDCRGGRVADKAGLRAMDAPTRTGRCWTRRWPSSPWIGWLREADLAFPDRLIQEQANGNHALEPVRHTQSGPCADAIRLRKPVPA